MGTKDKRIDAYIEKSPEYARPILSYLRNLVHEACPEVEEGIKWSMPCFMHQGMFCGMAADSQSKKPYRYRDPEGLTPLSRALLSGRCGPGVFCGSFASALGH